MRRLVFPFSLTAALVVPWTSAAPVSAQALCAGDSQSQTVTFFEQLSTVRSIGLGQQALAADKNGDGWVCYTLRTGPPSYGTSFTDDLSFYVAP